MKIEVYYVVSDGERWRRRIKERGMNEREERYRESLGAFLEYFKKIEVFFFKKHLSSDSLKITSSVFPDFQKCFLKIAKHFIFIPKTL